MTIRKINTDEVGIIHDLAHKIWPSTFSEILSKEQISYMLNWMYNSATLKQQIEEGHQFFLAEENGAPNGFMGIQSNYPDKHSTKIHKLYVLPEIQGKGTGRLLIETAIEVAKNNRNDRLVLNVNRFNKAVSFYQRIGFEILLEENIDIGNGYLMEDYVMERTI
jgi:GNAT superfamily N-acetyltransferase